MPSVQAGLGRQATGLDWPLGQEDHGDETDWAEQGPYNLPAWLGMSQRENCQWEQWHQETRP